MRYSLSKGLPVLGSLKRERKTSFQTDKVDPAEGAQIGVVEGNLVLLK